MQNKLRNNLLALDVGHVRIGVAIADSIARLPRPLKTIAMQANPIDEITQLVETEEIGTLIVGLPRGMQGQDTEQTQYVRTFVEQLQSSIQVEIVLQDEALTSKRAEAELRARKSRTKAPTVDELAATYILEDYLGITTEYNS